VTATHTDREYEAELEEIRETLLHMGAKVEEMIDASLQALVKRDSELAQRTIEADHQVNRLEIESDELCLRTLALRQPVASDLRFIASALKLVTDLERIGDLAVNICERVLELNAEPQLKPYIDLPRMAEVAKGMIRDALDAFVKGDVRRADQVIERDKELDGLFVQVTRELLTYMMEDAHSISRGTRLQSIAKYLERVGDHATNLAEMVIFLVMRRDIRHQGKLDEP
jgi:phosphate transport system protein